MSDTTTTDASLIPQGGMGGILANEPKRHRRRMCRDIVTILRFGGLFTQEQVEELLTAGHTVAVAAAQEGDARGYAAAAKVFLEAAKIEQADEPKEAEQPQNPLTVNVFNGDSIFMPPEQRRTVLISVMGNAPESLDAAAEKGMVESTAHPSGNGNAVSPVPAESGEVLPASTVAKANGHAGPGAG